jgi:hypothetical protein
VNGREPLSFARILSELDQDATAIASYLGEIDEPSAWSMMRRAEALVGKGATREEALKELDAGRGWGE